MQLKIDPSITAKFPHVKLGLLVAIGINNQGSYDEISGMLRSAEEELRKKVPFDTLATFPKIGDWREAYRSFGFKPSAFKSSIEALTRRVLKGGEIPSINPLVDLYNFISIKHILPMGGDDLDKVDGDITLTLADGSERFVMLGTDTHTEIKAGEVIYCDEKEVLCRAWNYRECEKSKITETTQNACLVIEGLEHTSQEEIMQALSELKQLLSIYCNGTFQEFYLDKDYLGATLTS